MKNNARTAFQSNTHINREWKEFLVCIRRQAFSHIAKYFHNPAEQEDVLAELVLLFIRKLLRKRGENSLIYITPTASEQKQFLAHLNDRVIDIERKLNGRQRLPSDIENKPLLEKNIYKKRFMQKVNAEAIIDELCTSDELDRKEIQAIIERLERDLGDKARKRSHGSKNDIIVPAAETSDITNLSDPSAEPDKSPEDQEMKALLLEAISQLDCKDQLILQYRYIDELKILDIAEMLQSERHHIVYRIERSLGKLSKYFKKRGFTIDDFI